MRRIRILALAAFAAVLAAGDASAPAKPEDAILTPIRALRQNDVLSLFKALPEAEQEEARADWTAGRDKPPGEDEAKLDGMLQVINQPGAIDMLMAQAEPALAGIDPTQLGFQLQMGAGMLGMMLASSPEGAPFAEALQGIATDLVAWLPKSGINDPAKLRVALGHLLDAGKSYEVADSAQLKALSLDQLLQRTGTAMEKLKAGLAVYGCDLDAFLDSVTVTQVEGEGDKRTATVQMTVLGKPRSLPVKLKLENGKWVGDESTLQPMQDLAAQAQGGGPGPMGEPMPAPGEGAHGPGHDHGAEEMTLEPIPAEPATP